MNNFLFDREANQITAIPDFDWAQIGLVADEILRPFHKRYTRFPGPTRRTQIVFCYGTPPYTVSPPPYLLHLKALDGT
jgi:hypothetical protein